LFYVLFSLKREASLLLSLIEKAKKSRISGHRVYSGYIDGESVRVIFTGMGKKELSEEIFKEKGLVISSGVCGALVPELKTGHVVISSECNYIDSDVTQEILGSLKKRQSGIRFFFGDFIEGNIVEELKQKYNSFRKTFGFSRELAGFIKESMDEAGLTNGLYKTLTVPKIIKNEAQKVLLNGVTGCGSVEMEDYHRAEFARKLGLDIVSLRVVLDEIIDDVPTFRTGFNVPNKAYSLFLKLSMASEVLAFSVKQVIKSLKNLKW